MEQPVKPNIGQYKVQPGRIEHYTPGKSSISDKEAKQVNKTALDALLLFRVSISDQSQRVHTMDALSNETYPKIIYIEY